MHRPYSSLSFNFDKLIIVEFPLYFAYFATCNKFHMHLSSELSDES